MEGDCGYYQCSPDIKNEGGDHYSSLLPLHTLAQGSGELKNMSLMLKQALVLLDVMCIIEGTQRNELLLIFTARRRL